MDHVRRRGYVLLRQLERRRLLLLSLLLLHLWLLRLWRRRRQLERRRWAMLPVLALHEQSPLVEEMRRDDAAGLDARHIRVGSRRSCAMRPEALRLL